MKQRLSSYSDNVEQKMMKNIIKWKKTWQLGIFLFKKHKLYPTYEIKYCFLFLINHQHNFPFTLSLSALRLRKQKIAAKKNKERVNYECQNPLMKLEIKIKAPHSILYESSSLYFYLTSSSMQTDIMLHFCSLENL